MEYSFYLNKFSFRTAANAFLRSGDLVNPVNNVPEVPQSLRLTFSFSSQESIVDLTPVFSDNITLQDLLDLTVTNDGICNYTGLVLVSIHHRCGHGRIAQCH